MTPEEEQAYETLARNKFKTWDVDNDGALSMEEIQRVFEDASVPVSNSQLQALYGLMANKDGKVELDDFLAFAAKRRKALRKAFDNICNHGGAAPASDAGSERRFTAGHLRRAAQRADVVLSDKDVHDIMKQLDRNKDGSVTFHEFLNCTMLVPHVNPHVFFDRWFVDAYDDHTIGFGFPREIRLREGEEFSDMVLRKISCGGAAGILSRTVTAPIDRVRLLMMTSAKRLGLGSAYSAAIAHPDGFRALWIGNAVNCVKIAPEMALKLYAFDAFKNAIAQDADDVSMTERFVAGGCAGALAEFAVYPMDVLRTRMATGLYANISACARAIHQDGGVRAFYAGLTPGIAGIIPFAAIDLSVYSMLKDIAVAYLEENARGSSVPLLLSCGMVSSATAASLTFPIMVIRTKAQAANMPITKVARTLWNEGIRGFYRGLSPSLMAVMPATSISYSSYEWLNAQWMSTRTV